MVCYDAVDDNDDIAVGDAADVDAGWRIEKGRYKEKRRQMNIINYFNHSSFCTSLISQPGI